MDSARLRINSENVVHETVDGEVIVIDLSSGSYYSLAGCGPAIWEMLGQGATAAEISVSLEARFEAKPDEIEEAVSGLLAQLGESTLIVPGDGSAAPAQPAQNGSNDRLPFVPPVFERYTDMKDYFLLDPIHEVSPTGWPNKPGE